MKKLLILSLISSIALAETTVVVDIKEGAQEVGEQLAEAGKTVVDVAMVPVNATKEVVVDIANSPAGNDVADVAGQIFIDAPKQVAEGVRDGAKATYETAKDVTSQVANSTVVQSIKNAGVAVGTATKNVAVATGDAVKNATAKVVQVTKNGANKVKDGALIVINSEPGQDLAELGGQISDIPGQVYEDVTDLGKAIGTKFVNVCRAVKNELVN